MNKNFLKIFFSMSFFLILGKILGFVRTALVASTYGAGFISDIYSFEDSFINEIFAIFSTFLACAFIPRYLSLDENGRNRLFNLLLNWGTVIMLFFTVICYVFTKPLLYIFVPGYFELYNIDQIIYVTRINLIMLIITFLVNYILVVLQAHEIFIYLSFESIILNIVVISYLFVIPEQGIVGLLLCRIVAYLLLLILVSVKLKKSIPLSYKFILTIRDKNLIDMVRLSIPMLGITVLWQVNYIIDKSMASELVSGSVACLHYANMISMIIYNVIGYIVSTYAYPTLSKIQSNDTKVKKTFNEYLAILLQLVLPVSILTMFYAGYASELLYGHGNMSNDSVKIIAHILIMYLPGSIAYCIKNLYSKLFYIKQNTKIVLIIDVVGCLVNIVLNLTLVKVMGVYGLALATSISYCSTVILQIIFANRKKYTNLKISDLKSNVVLLFFLISTGYVTSIIFDRLINNSVLSFIYVAVIYIFTYVLCGYKELKKRLNKVR